jgi:hypothetical protein
MTRPKADVLSLVCGELSTGNLEGAKNLAREEYPFMPVENAGRNYSEAKLMSLFLRDGFIDRYSGERLVFPGTLRLLSVLMPEEFPAHPNWKMSASHIVYWELFPTLDHVMPVARGGADDSSNWVTTSMVRNSAKSNWTLEELRWQLYPPGTLSGWDGLTEWCLTYTTQHPEALRTPYVKRWCAAAVVALNRERRSG